MTFDIYSDLALDSNLTITYPFCNTGCTCTNKILKREQITLTKRGELRKI